VSWSTELRGRNGRLTLVHRVLVLARWLVARSEPFTCHDVSDTLSVSRETANRWLRVAREVGLVELVHPVKHRADGQPGLEPAVFRSLM
jgi:hypothetical protein